MSETEQDWKPTNPFEGILTTYHVYSYATRGIFLVQARNYRSAALMAVDQEPDSEEFRVWGEWEYSGDGMTNGVDVRLDDNMEATYADPDRDRTQEAQGPAGRDAKSPLNGKADAG